jgi:hypothetical protein
MKKFSIILTLFLLSFSVWADGYSGFCWAVKNNSNDTLCTPTKSVGAMIAVFQAQCTLWAKGLGADHWGAKMDNDPGNLQRIRDSLCGDPSNYICLAQVSGAATSSIGPLGNYKVLAGNESQAIDKCVDAAAAEILKMHKKMAPDEALAIKVKPIP